MLLTADRVLVNDELRAGVGVEIGAEGRIRRVGDLAAMGRADRVLANRALLPGFVNAHSHSFQRLLRGRTQVRGGDDDFWSWRQVMYQVAGQLNPDTLFIAARQAFLEMAPSGVWCR
jgi:formimidoylglutamate deiminase